MFTYFVHRLEPFSRFSTMYPLIGLPPVFVGGSQVSAMESSVVPSHSGSPGLPGGSVHRHFYVVKLSSVTNSTDKVL